MKAVTTRRSPRPRPLPHDEAAALSRAYATRTVAAAAPRTGKQGPPPKWIDLYLRRYRWLTGRPTRVGPTT